MPEGYNSDDYDKYFGKSSSHSDKMSERPDSRRNASDLRSSGIPGNRHVSSNMNGKKYPEKSQVRAEHGQYTEPYRKGDFEDISSDSHNMKRSTIEPNRGRDYIPAEKKPIRKKKKRHAGLFILFLCLIILGFVFNYYFGGLNVKPITGNRSELGISPNVVSDPNIVNIALFGVDSREDSFEGRSDTIMVLSLNKKKRQIKLISIMRDSYVDIEGCGKDKITHAYVWGGPLLAIKTLNQNFNLDIKSYVTVNFHSMAKIVDAFGGSYVEITSGEMTEINNNLNLLLNDEPNANVLSSDYLNEYGWLKLNGNQAVAYSRIRNIGGDEERVVRQQLVLRGLSQSSKELSLLEYPEVVRIILPMCETSMGHFKLASFIPSLMSGAEIETLSLPSFAENPEGGFTEERSWIFIFDIETAARHIDAFIKQEKSQYYSEFY